MIYLDIIVTNVPTSIVGDRNDGKYKALYCKNYFTKSSHLEPYAVLKYVDQKIKFKEEFVSNDFEEPIYRQTFNTSY